MADGLKYLFKAEREIRKMGLGVKGRRETDRKDEETHTRDYEGQVE